MASKLVILAAAMATLVVLTHATVITTVVEDDSNHNQMGHCRRQLRSQWPDHCESYLMQSMRGRRYGRGEEDEMNQGRQYFDQCCQELRMMDPQCQCQAMESMMEQMGSSQMSQRVMEKAMGLPMMCGTMHHRCSMSYMM